MLDQMQKYFFQTLTVSFLLLSSPAFSFEAPYSNPNFRNALNQSKLQYPGVKSNINYGKFARKGAPYFYLESHKYMVLKASKPQSKPVVRSELRFGPSMWKVESSKLHYLFADFNFPKPHNLKQVTLLQIHAKKPSYPPIRVVWLEKRKGKKDHIWAIVRPSPYDKKINYVDLGPRVNGFMNYTINVQNSRMKVMVGNNLRVNQSLHLWHGTKNYFKAGVYLSGKHDKGSALIRFRVLESS
jgi:hypothetical protein